MYLFIKTQTIARRCCHQVFSNLKCYSKVFSYEKNVQALSSNQIRSYNKKRDDLKVNAELIYHGKLSKSIRYVKILSITTSFISLSVQPWLLPKIIETGSISALITTIIIFGGFAFISPIALHLITNRYALDLFYDNRRDVYIATTYTILAKIKEFEFTPDDITKPKGMQLMTTCIIKKKKPIFFDYNDFKDLNHYSRILGYDKPMDFMLNQTVHESINASSKTEVKKNM